MASIIQVEHPQVVIKLYSFQFLEGVERSLYIVSRRDWRGSFEGIRCDQLSLPSGPAFSGGQKPPVDVIWVTWLCITKIVWLYRGIMIERLRMEASCY